MDKRNFLIKKSFAFAGIVGLMLGAGIAGEAQAMERNLINNHIDYIYENTLDLTSDINLYIDVDLKNNVMVDRLDGANITGSGNINIVGINLMSDLPDEVFYQSNMIANDNLANRTKLMVSTAPGSYQTTAYTPIHKYDVSYYKKPGIFGGEDGYLAFSKAGAIGSYESLNPVAVAAPVAAQLGGYFTLLNNYDQAFRNMDMYMLMTKEQRQAMKLQNSYAAEEDNLVYDSSINMYENKAAWFRPYATFENVSLNNGPKVKNFAYGSLFGVDSELYELGHGWDGMLSVYAGYNGSHQKYDGVSIYQNGGSLGLSGIAYKDNFFSGLTVNVGASIGEANGMFGREDFTMLFSGVASKSGYNWELADGKFIIQPSMLMSYSFVNTFDYRNAAGVDITSDPLHVIQLEPGVKFIGNLKNGWQPYAGISMVWNIMDKTHFKANDITLPELSVDPFVKYGVGVRKSWGDRFTGFFQTYITNGGRNGVGLQGGFKWMLGKDETTKSAKTKTSDLQPAKAQISLNSI